MTTPKPILRDTDLEHVVSELARFDESGVNDAQTGSADSTVQQLKAELDTLVAELRSPPPFDEFADESDCRRAIEFVERIGRDPTFSTQQSLSAGTAEQPDLGQIGPYQIVQRLGEGGMGAVYKAIHTKLKKIVAVKVLPVERMRDAAAIARFEREMEAVGKLQHPNIVSAHDAGKAGDTHFLVMEYVDGLDLSEIVRRVGPLDVADACEIARQAALGLQEAHENNMVHRDVKPSNLMLANVGRGHQPPLVKILDLGLALLNEQAAEQRDLTTTGQMMGTLEYMAPEQGGDSHVVDIRADVYALGATLYKLLSGEAPFPGSRYDTPLKMIRALALEPTPSISTRREGLPMELVVVINRMLAKDPAQRFTVPQEVADALARFSAGANLAALLQRATTNAARPAADQSAIQTHEHITADSHETAPNIDNAAQAAAPTLATTKSFRVSDTPVRPVPSLLPKGRVAGAGGFQIGSTLAALRDGSNRRRTSLISAAAMGGILLLGAVILYLLTRNGTLVVEIDDPSITVSVVGEDVVISDPTVTVDPASKDHKQAGQPIKLRPGDHKLHVTRGDLEFDSDNFTLKRGEKVVLTVKLAEGRVQVVRNEKVIGQGAMRASTTGDPDRRAAEWVLSLGDTNIDVYDNGQERRVNSVGELPGGPFQLSRAAIQVEVSDSDLAVFKGCRNLTVLILGSTNVSDAGLAYFRDCPNLTYLALQHTKVTDAGLENFKDCRNLTILNLSSTKVTGAGLVHFKQCTDLGILNFSGSPVNDSGLAHVKNFKNLTHLDLTGTQVSDAGLAHVKEIGSLIHLNINHTKITDAGLSTLTRLNKLNELDINENRQLTADAVKKLAAALPQCLIRSDYGVFGQPLDPDRRAAEWVLSIGANIHIKQNGPEWAPKAVGDLPPGAFELTRVQLDSNPKLSDAGLANFKGCKNLTHLVLRSNQVTDAGLAHFKDCKNLTNLGLQETQVSDAGLAQFKDCKNLTSLGLATTKVTDAGLAHFKDCKYLDGLVLSDCKQVSDTGLANFKDCKNIASLFLSNTQVSDAGLAYFEDCKNLTNLGLQMTRVTDAGLEQFKNYKNLKILHLNGAQVSDAGLEHLKDCTNITELNLVSTRVTDAGLTHFKDFKHLTELSVKDTQVSDAGLAYLSGCLKLGFLNVRNTKVTEAGVKKLSADLPKCKIEWDGGVIEPMVVESDS